LARPAPRDAGVAPASGGTVRRVSEIYGALRSGARRSSSRESREYCSVVVAFSRRRCWAEALGVIADMQAQSVAPKVIACNNAIGACGKSGQWQHALALFDDMRGSGAAADAVTYRGAISACEEGGRWEWALHLLAEAESTGATPDVRTLCTPAAAFRAWWCGPWAEGLVGR